VNVASALASWPRDHHRVNSDNLDHRLFEVGAELERPGLLAEMTEMDRPTASLRATPLFCAPSVSHSDGA
jgi:hypothetical protein